MHNKNLTDIERELESISSTQDDICFTTGKRTDTEIRQHDIAIINELTRHLNAWNHIESVFHVLSKL